MSGEMLNEGKPIFVTTPRDRIGHGPWARLLVAAIVGSEGSTTAERGRALARGGAVYDVSVSSGTIAARVAGEDGRECVVSFSADPIAPRVWSAVGMSARRNERLAAAVAGREQSVHLEHVTRFDWDAPLVPNASGLSQSCSCDGDSTCAHIASLAYVIADVIDGDPSVLLEWRGCNAAEVPEAPVTEEIEAEPWIDSSDVRWQVGRLPGPRRARPLPAGAVLMCLGPSELRTAGGDLPDSLRRAYATFSGAAPS